MDTVLKMVPRRMSSPDGKEVVISLLDGTPLLDFIAALIVNTPNDTSPDAFIEMQQTIVTLQDQLVTMGETLVSAIDRIAELEERLADYSALKAGLSDFAEALD